MTRHSCLVYSVDLDVARRYHVGTIQSHTNMPKWLKDNGEIEYVYEIWKVGLIHSRWFWNKNKMRWARTASIKNE